VELGELELAVLRAIRTLGEAMPGNIYREVQRSRGAAYTSVTTTLYRLVDKGLVAIRKESQKKIFYSIRDGKAYERAMSSLMQRVVDAFGTAAISYVLENPGSLAPAEVAELRRMIVRMRTKESRHGRSD